jgi:glycosyltransferase involved in cell wall biosynthesis
MSTRLTSGRQNEGNGGATGWAGIMWAVSPPLRIAYTLEQCWHPVPGGTAVAALRVAERLVRRDDVELVGVAGRHRQPPAEAFRPPMPVRQLPFGRPWLYEAWLRSGRPRVERATGPVDVCHSTALVPAPSEAAGVVTVHDLAFLHTPERFTGHGARMMRRSLDVIRRRPDLVLCSSTATMDDLAGTGVAEHRLRLVPLGVERVDVEPDDVARVGARYDLPPRFVLFVGTVEPRKNLARLAAAVARLGEPTPLVVAGADGWGGAAEAAGAAGADVHFVGFVDPADLPALYALATVFAYPSEWEGFGLPVAEAMAHGAPVVTSRGVSTEEVAGGAAVLVEPTDVDDIARGLADAFRDAAALRERGLARAAELSWDVTADRTVAAYRDAAS